MSLPAPAGNNKASSSSTAQSNIIRTLNIWKEIVMGGGGGGVGNNEHFNQYQTSVHSLMSSPLLKTDSCSLKVVLYIFRERMYFSVGGRLTVGVLRCSSHISTAHQWKKSVKCCEM